MKKRILIVDDEAFTMASMVDLLKDKGFAVETATTLSQAEASLRNRAFDGLIVDCVMATGHGFLDDQQAGIQLIERIRSGGSSLLESNREIPILVLTAVCDRETLSELNRADVQGVFQKPVSPLELIENLNALFSKR